VIEQRLKPRTTLSAAFIGEHVFPALANSKLSPTNSVAAWQTEQSLKRGFAQDGVPDIAACAQETGAKYYAAMAYSGSCFLAWCRR
jgi:hypothetical protein